MTTDRYKLFEPIYKEQEKVKKQEYKEKAEQMEVIEKSRIKVLKPEDFSEYRKQAVKEIMEIEGISEEEVIKQWNNPQLRYHKKHKQKMEDEEMSRNKTEQRSGEKIEGNDVKEEKKEVKEKVPRKKGITKLIRAEFDKGNFGLGKIATDLDVNKSTVSTQLYNWKKEQKGGDEKGDSKVL